MGLQVSLREIRPADLAVLFEHQLEPEATAMAAFPPREWPAFEAHWKKVLAHPKVKARTVLCDLEVAGQVGSWELEGKRQVGYWIGKAFWGRGVGTAALAEFLTVDRVRPLYAHVAVQNAGSVRVLLKCGFVVRGKEEAVSIGGGPAVDEWLMVLDAAAGGAPR